MSVKFSNNAVTTLSAGISAGATSFTVASASTFPTLGASDWTYVSLTSEVVKVTAISGTTFTCDATSGAHAIGATVELRMTSEILNDVALGDDETLAAYNNTTAITGNAVDVFIYDTSNDSDGGAWRKRTQATSWYNETLNTATRGSRKEFPSVAVIVAEAQKLTIYDGDTPDLDMWMVFSGDHHLQSNATYPARAITALNGSIVKASSVYGIAEVNFIKDTGDIYWHHTQHRKSLAPISGRNSTQVYTNDTDRLIVDDGCNDIAMTVLPNAPIDSTTGLPIPTIAVATDGGVSVIKDDGSVVDLSTTQGSNYNVSTFINFHGEKLLFGMDAYPSYSRRIHYQSIPATDITFSVNGSSPDQLYATENPNSSVPDILGGIGYAHSSMFAGGAIGGVKGLNKINRPDNYFAYLTSTYNSGYMTGDIKGAWLADTDTTNITYDNRVSNGDFASAAVNWGVYNSSGTIATVGGRLQFTSIVAGLHGVVYGVTGLVVGKQYLYEAEIESSGVSPSVRVQISGIGLITSTGVSTAVNTVTKVYDYFIASSTSHILEILNYSGASGDVLYIDNVSFSLVDQNRLNTLG